MSVPGALKHNWCFDLELSTNNADGAECYRCEHCKQWSSTPNNDSLCPARNRRRVNRRKWNDRRKAQENLMLIYAMALAEIPCR
jgi:hypothetical protein